MKKYREFLMFVKMLIAFIAFTGLSTWLTTAYAGLEVQLTAQELVEQADAIVAAEVVAQRSFIREDQRGKHIYTEVSLDVFDTLKDGDLPGKITIEVIGGVYEGWREEVSYSPVFLNGEKSVLFLKTLPFRLVGSKQGRRPLRDGFFTLESIQITPSNFKRALSEHQAKRSMGQTINLKSLIELYGIPHISPPNFSPPSGRSALQVMDEDLVESSGGPRDGGGGTVPQDELPAIHK